MSAAFDSPTILIVDDEASIRDLVRRVLINEGYRIVEASDGEEAFRLAVNHTGDIDLLLTDLKMPRMDGKELADALRARQPRLKVLFLTAFADSLFDDRDLLDEGTAYLEKPVTPRGLNEAVRLLLYGSLDHKQGAPPPPPAELPLARDIEVARLQLASGALARVLVTGVEVSTADLEEIVRALTRKIRDAS